jgi:5,10-methylene-tetrahydrofolate dehydrogenase/methenyl tetrahydrofolate cyclohydrolase
MAGLIIGGLLIDAGHNVEGLAAIVVGLGPVVGAFLYRQIKAANDSDPA